jgi:hypothetical protein
MTALAAGSIVITLSLTPRVRASDRWLAQTSG